MLLFLLLPLLSQASNVAIFAPNMANSQVLWNKRVGEELARAGHNVTIFLLDMFENEAAVVTFDPSVHVVSVNMSVGHSIKELQQMQSDTAFKNIPLWDKRMRAMMEKFGDMWRTCEVMVKNKALIDTIRDSHFDVAFTHMYNFCQIGVIHLTEIPTWVWLNSGALMDNVAELMGVPLPPSYCTPMMMDAGDRLSFLERTKSFVGHIMYKIFWRRMMVDSETAMFKREFGDDFPDLADLAKEAPLVMVNSNELYDFARPILAKIINIGGLGIKASNAKELTGEFASRVKRAKQGIVVMTFGSVAPMYLMPKEWRDAFFAAFRQFPDVEFFIRYEYPDLIKDILPLNVFAAKWLPQTDLLQHPKALGLISHGGYNSLQDSIHAAKPILTIGLFGDQFRNAHLAARLGLGVNLKKDDVNMESVHAKVEQLIRDPSLKEAALRLREMVATRPIASETLLVKWTEFLIQHKHLDNLIPAGASLSLFVYHSVDVIVAIISALVVILLLIFLVLRGIYRFICRIFFCGKKVKDDEKEKKNQ